jgi:uncharacterized protein YggE
MAVPKNRGSAGVPTPARPTLPQQTKAEEKSMTPSFAVRPQTTPAEGIAVTGEGLHRVTAESAEFVVEIAVSAPTAAQALHEHKTKTAQVTQTLAPLGVQRGDLQTISMNVAAAYLPLLPSMPYAAPPQIGPGAYGSFGGGQFGGAGTALQTDLQFGSYQARSLLRLSIRETARAGEIVDALNKAGANLAGGLTFRAADESAARKAALDAASRDARAKAETLATGAGKQVGDPVAIQEEIVVSNGMYSALRAQSPFGFGPATPQFAGELEYYARVTASFRFQ